MTVINLDPVISSSDLDFSICTHLQRCWHYSATTQWDEIFPEGSVECLLVFEKIVHTIKSRAEARFTLQKIFGGAKNCDASLD